MTGEERNNDELESYLLGKDGLSGEYRKASAESPPAGLDAAILAASRKAVISKPPGTGTRFSSHWHIPVSIAAVIALSVLLVFNIPDDTSRAPYETGFNSEYRGAGQDLDEDLMENAGPSQDTLLMKNEAVLENQAGATAAGQAAAPRAPADVERIEADSTAQMRDTAAGAGNKANEVSDSLPGQTPVRRIQGREAGSPGRSDSNTATAADEVPPEVTATGLEQATQVRQMRQCTTPRPEVCSEEFIPVCALRDTGIRCVTTPCDSTESIVYSNACSACRDVDVISYSMGRCE